MLKGRYSQLSNFNQFLLSLCLVVGTSFIILFLGSLLCYLFFGINIITDTNALDIYSDNPNIAALKFYQAIYSTGMFIIPPFFIAYLLSSNVSEYLNINKRVEFSSFIKAFLLILVSLPLINMMGDLNSQIHFPDFLKNIEQWMRESEEQAALVTQKFLSMNNLSDLLVNLILIAVIPALGEELLLEVCYKSNSQNGLGAYIGAFSYRPPYFQHCTCSFLASFHAFFWVWYLDTF